MSVDYIIFMFCSFLRSYLLHCYLLSYQKWFSSSPTSLSSGTRYLACAMADSHINAKLVHGALKYKSSTNAHFWVAQMSLRPSNLTSSLWAICAWDVYLTDTHFLDAQNAHLSCWSVLVARSPIVNRVNSHGKYKLKDCSHDAQELVKCAFRWLKYTFDEFTSDPWAIHELGKWVHWGFVKWCALELFQCAFGELAGEFCSWMHHELCIYVWTGHDLCIRFLMKDCGIDE